MDEHPTDDEPLAADEDPEPQPWETSWSIDEPLPTAGAAEAPAVPDPTRAAEVTASDPAPGPDAAVPGATKPSSSGPGATGDPSPTTASELASGAAQPPSPLLPPPASDLPPPESLIPPPPLADLPPSEALTPPPPPADLPPSRALIPPPAMGGLLPPSPLRRPADDVYRADSEQYQDFREGPSARRPRSRYTALATAPPPQAQPPRLKPSMWFTVFIPLLAGAVGAGLVVGGFFLLRDGEDAPAAAPIAATNPVTIRETVRTEFVDPNDVGADATAVARKVIPSVVAVEVGLRDDGGGFSGTGSGSGVVLSADGYVVTNEHVVNGSESFDVLFSDGRKYQADLLGADPVTDLAVLKIEADGLVPIDIGNTAGLAIGDVAIAAGSPLGLQGGPTVTVGVISAFNREVRTGSGTADTLLGMLQTDAPITRGSSGGALVDARGALIGVTSAVGVSDVGVEGIGFAIPVEVVQRITDELIANGAVEHSFLGIEGRTSLEDQADGAEVAVGVFVQAIVEESGAAAGGIEEGDVIISVAGHPVRTINTLVGELRRYRVGEPLDVEIVRGGETLHLTIELGPRPDDA